MPKPTASEPHRGTELLTTEQTSKLLQVPASTLQVWRSTCRVPLPFHKVGGHVRYRREDIEAFLSQNRHGVV